MADRLEPAVELVAAGRLSEAQDLLTGIVRERPSELPARNLLIDVLLFRGDYARAERQVAAIEQLDADQRSKTGQLRQTLAAARMRDRILAGDGAPAFLTPVRESLQAWADARQRGDSSWPVFEDGPPATVNGREFSAIADGDRRFHGVIEAFAGERYVWIPFEQVVSLTLDDRSRRRGAAWTGALAHLANGTRQPVFLPLTYPGSVQTGDGEVQRGLVTRWREVESGAVEGVGQHVWFCGDEDIALLDIAQLQVAPAPVSQEQP